MKQNLIYLGAGVVAIGLAVIAYLMFGEDKEIKALFEKPSHELVREVKSKDKEYWKSHSSGIKSQQKKWQQESESLKAQADEKVADPKARSESRRNQRQALDKKYIANYLGFLSGQVAEKETIDQYFNSVTDNASDRPSGLVWMLYSDGFSENPYFIEKCMAEFDNDKKASYLDQNCTGLFRKFPQEKLDQIFSGKEIKDPRLVDMMVQKRLESCTPIPKALFSQWMVAIKERPQMAMSKIIHPKAQFPPDIKRQIKEMALDSAKGNSKRREMMAKRFEEREKRMASRPQVNGQVPCQVKIQ